MTDTERLPKYYRVKEVIMAEIDGLQPGSPLPDERTLAASFETSRTTIRQALQELSREGRIMRRQGHGTFVAEPKLTLPLRLSSHTEDMHELGMVPSSRVLSVTDEYADDTIGDALGISAGDPITVISRVRLADGIPLALEINHLSQARFPGIARLINDHVSLYEILVDDYAVTPDHALETIESAPATPEEAKLLETEIGTPMMLMSRQSFESDGDAFEYVRSVYRGDRYRFATRLAT